VATVNLDCKLDLKTIAFHARNVEYNPKVRNPKLRALRSRRASNDRDETLGFAFAKKTRSRARALRRLERPDARHGGDRTRDVKALTRFTLFAVFLF